VNTQAIVLNAPGSLDVRALALNALGAADVLVDVAYAGVSTGTERLLWTGRMPPFPGMGYPLVPGYESVGRIVDAGPEAVDRIGEYVFVPGANCYADARGLFGGNASRLILPAARATALPDSLREDGVLLALAATARHAIAGGPAPDLIVGHGVLGRLLARIVIAQGDAAPTVWETNSARHGGAHGYDVIHPDSDTCRDYRCICDASGAVGLLDTLIARLARGGEVVLAGFYEEPVAFAFPPAFMREARIRVAAEWKPEDLAVTTTLIASGALSLGGLITHRAPAHNARDAYPTAFEDAACLKMVLDWSGVQ